jgi:hypothetical protein
MTNNLEHHEYRDRTYILTKYPISNRTYNNRVKKLETPELSGYTKTIKFGKRVIHESILDEVFLPHRVPNYDKPHQIKKWVHFQMWDYIGNITPPDSDVNTNLELVNELMKILKEFDKTLVLFYSVEHSLTIKDTYHTHFLIKSSTTLTRGEIWSKIKGNDLLHEFLKNDYKTNSKFWFDSYNYKAFDTLGIDYTLKYDIKCGICK